MPAQRKTATATELAAMCGKSAQAVIKQMRRHNVKSVKNRYNIEKALAAMALGASLDKRNTEKELKQMEAKGVDPDNIIYKSKLAQYRKVVLQGDMLEHERDKMRSEVVPKKQYRDGMLQLQNILLRLWDIWMETIAAKYRDAALLSDMRKGREQLLNETTAVLEEKD